MQVVSHCWEMQLRKRNETVRTTRLFSQQQSSPKLITGRWCGSQHNDYRIVVINQTPLPICNLKPKWPVFKVQCVNVIYWDENFYYKSNFLFFELLAMPESAAVLSLPPHFPRPAIKANRHPSKLESWLCISWTSEDEALVQAMTWIIWKKHL